MDISGPTMTKEDIKNLQNLLLSTPGLIAHQMEAIFNFIKGYLFAFSPRPMFISITQGPGKVTENDVEEMICPGVKVIKSKKIPSVIHIIVNE